MKEARYFYVPNIATEHELPEEEAKHALRVLRLKEGDEMFLMDGCGSFYRAHVSMATNKRCVFDIDETLPQTPTWTGHIHLGIAPTKDMGRIEWMVEKATEIGFDEISFLDTQFSERKTLRTDRIDKIIIAATKQSRKAWKPVVNEMVPFHKFMEAHQTGHRFICHCYTEVERKLLYPTLLTLPKNEDITILVGPEGDFSIDEVRHALSQGYESVTLGNSRLRTETAGLYAVMLANLCKQ